MPSSCITPSPCRGARGRQMHVQMHVHALRLACGDGASHAPLRRGKETSGQLKAVKALIAVPGAITDADPAQAPAIRRLYVEVLSRERMPVRAVSPRLPGVRVQAPVAGAALLALADLTAAILLGTDQDHIVRCEFVAPLASKPRASPRLPAGCCPPESPPQGAPANAVTINASAVFHVIYVPALGDRADEHQVRGLVGSHLPAEREASVAGQLV